MSGLDVDARQLAKEAAARAALEYVEDGMILGLGSGSTAEAFIHLLGEKLAETGWRVSGVPTSETTRAIAIGAGVPLKPVEQATRIDLAVDGADEVDADFSLIKGGGGMLLREKIIANAADHFLVIIDQSKVVDRLGAFPLPVEVEPFGFTITAKAIFDILRETGCGGNEVSLRSDAQGRPFMTDGGHYVLDCAAASIPEPDATDAALQAIPGVIETGLFIDMARTVIIGAPDEAEILER